MPLWRQAVIWTSAGLSSIKSLRTNFGEIWVKIPQFSLKKDNFVNDVCKMMSILSWPQCVQALYLTMLWKGPYRVKCLSRSIIKFFSNENHQLYKHAKYSCDFISCWRNIAIFFSMFYYIVDFVCGFVLFVSYWVFQLEIRLPHWGLIIMADNLQTTF